MEDHEEAIGRRSRGRRNDIYCRLHSLRHHRRRSPVADLTEFLAMRVPLYRANASRPGSRTKIRRLREWSRNMLRQMRWKVIARLLALRDEDRA